MTQRRDDEEKTRQFSDDSSEDATRVINLNQIGPDPGGASRREERNTPNEAADPPTEEFSTRYWPEGFLQGFPEEPQQGYQGDSQQGYPGDPQQGYQQGGSPQYLSLIHI